jgi:AcrR family transcriptional regulator
MAREKSESKRAAILAEAKRLFAERGFHATSVNDIVSRLELPVGSIYTYFKSKDEIIDVIIEEGWNGFIGSLKASLESQTEPEARMSAIVYGFLPALFRDTELISLFLNEASRIGKLDEKLEELTRVISSVIFELAKMRDVAIEMGPQRAMVALAVFFLGALDTSRLSTQLGLAVNRRDVVDFIAAVIENAFGVKLSDVGVPQPEF